MEKEENQNSTYSDHDQDIPEETEKPDEHCRSKMEPPQIWKLVGGSHEKIQERTAEKHHILIFSFGQICEENTASLKWTPPDLEIGGGFQ